MSNGIRRRALVGVAVAAVLAALLGRERLTARGAAVATGESTVRASRLEIVDDAGEVRAVIGTRPDGQAQADVFLELHGAEKKGHVSLSCSTSGAGDLALVQGSGRVSVRLHSSPAGEASVVLGDKRGNPRVHIRVPVEGPATVCCFDEDQKVTGEFPGRE